MNGAQTTASLFYTNRKDKASLEHIFVQVKAELRYATKTQKIQNGIEVQTAVFKISGEKWAEILAKGQAMVLFSMKEIGILQIASQMPEKIHPRNNVLSYWRFSKKRK